MQLVQHLVVIIKLMFRGIEGRLGIKGSIQRKSFVVYIVPVDLSFELSSKKGGNKMFTPLYFHPTICALSTNFLMNLSIVSTRSWVTFEISFSAISNSQFSMCDKIYPIIGGRTLILPTLPFSFSLTGIAFAII